MRQIMQSIVHKGHLGIEKCKALARKSMYWPGMSRDVEMTVSKCTVCNAYRKQQPTEPLLPHAVPQRPGKKVGADIFIFARKDYLLVVDYFSKYPEFALLEDKTTSSIIHHLKSIFARHGIPMELIADNMPFSSKAMREFANDWDFTITTSSPTFALNYRCRPLRCNRRCFSAVRHCVHVRRNRRATMTRWARVSCRVYSLETSFEFNTRVNGNEG